MRKLGVFNQVSLDGYFVDLHGDMSWAHQSDAEWQAFTEENAGRGGELLFGRVTYELMASYWPSAYARQNDPIVAGRMNSLPKVVFSRTLDEPSWNNTRLVNDDILTAVRRLKEEPGDEMVIFGSGSIIAQLAPADLIDEYQIVLVPIVLGAGRTLFEGIENKLPLMLVDTRRFGNGNVLLWYKAIVERESNPL